VNHTYSKAAGPVGLDNFAESSKLHLLALSNAGRSGARTNGAI
jgi:hypothetical protein